MPPLMVPLLVRRPSATTTLPELITPVVSTSNVPTPVLVSCATEEAVELVSLRELFAISNVRFLPGAVPAMVPDKV